MADLYEIAFARNMSGGGGTSDYDDLTSKPQINGTTLTGDKSSADLGLLPVSTKYGSSIEATPIATAQSQKMNLTLKDRDGNALDTTSFDLPIKDIRVNIENAGLSLIYQGGLSKLLYIDALISGKVDKIQGKGLSTEDYTTDEKNKLANIDSIIDSTPTSGSAHPVSSGGVYTALTGKVDKVQGKGLSTEDFTAMYKAWLDVSMQSPLNHNGIFRGKDLTNVYTIDQMYDMVHAGTFDDLFLGDYINVSITTTLPDETVKTETVSLMIAAFDYYYNMGDTALTTHHVIFVPRSVGFSTASKMNDTDTTVGSYLHSYMHETVLPCYAASLKVALNNHVLSHRTLLPNVINSSTPSMAGAGLAGASSGWTWTTVELQLMTEQQVFGTRAWTSSAYDVGIDYRKLPVFDFITSDQYGRANFWLRSVVSSTNFTYCTGTGYSFNGGASGAGYVRPLIVFG